MNLFDVTRGVPAHIGPRNKGKANNGPRDATKEEVRAYLLMIAQRRGVFVPDDVSFSHAGIYSDEHGSILVMPGYGEPPAMVTMETLGEDGEVIASQTMPIEPKKGGVVWTREVVRRTAGPVLKVAKPRKAKAAPIAEPAAAPPIEAPEIPASAVAGERGEAPDAPMGQIDADALREAPAGNSGEEFETAPILASAQAKTAELQGDGGEFKPADPIAELTARLAALESRVATLSGESIAAPTVAKRTPAHERAIRRAWAERAKVRGLRFNIELGCDQLENAQAELRAKIEIARLTERVLADTERQLAKHIAHGNALQAKRRRAVLSARDLQKRLNAEHRLVDLYAAKRREAEDVARDWSVKEEAQRQRASVAEAALSRLQADLADPHQPERESDLLLLKRQRDDARAEAERERNAAAAVNERNARLQSVMADLGERFEVMAGRVARAEAALRVQGAVA